MKIIKIDRCLGCPYCHIIHTVRFTSAVTLGCKKVWRKTEDDAPIPSWCPLEDAVLTSAMHSDGFYRCPTCDDRIIKPGHCHNPHCPDRRR